MTAKIGYFQGFHGDIIPLHKYCYATIPFCVYTNCGQVIKIFDTDISFILR